jgi:hypothetical protein
MASNVVATEQKRNETTSKKASKEKVKRISLKERKVLIQKKEKELEKERREGKISMDELMKQYGELEKEKKILANQEKKARESFHAAASLYPCNGIYDAENYLVVGAVLSFDDAKNKGFAFKSENEFKEFRAWYYEKYKNVLQISQPDFLLQTFRKVQKALQKKMEEAEQA